MSHYRYRVVLTPDLVDGGFVVTVPALPGVVTEGDTFEEALEMAKDAIRAYLESLLLDGEAIPVDDQRAGYVLPVEVVT